jgi:hypothetical protein
MKNGILVLAVCGLWSLSTQVWGGNEREADRDHSRREIFAPRSLVLSRSVYVGNAGTVAVGQTLPPGCVAGTVAVPLLAGGTASIKVKCATAVADGTYPGVFDNDQVDGSFGITSPIFLDNLTTDGEHIRTFALPADRLVTSFSSKSELALNLSSDGTSITFVGYNNGGLSSSQLTATQIGLDLIDSTGAELLLPGDAAPLPPDIDKIGDFEITQVGYKSPDKAGKDNNFRGLTVFNDTLYVTKGSGGNGINTVYQVGVQGILPTGSHGQLAQAPITILPGFPTSLASGVDQNNQPAPVAFPFGIWFADASTLYVCDEGDGTLVSPPVDGRGAEVGPGEWELAAGLRSSGRPGDRHPLRRP